MNRMIWLVGVAFCAGACGEVEPSRPAGGPDMGGDMSGAGGAHAGPGSNSSAGSGAHGGGGGDGGALEPLPPAPEWVGVTHGLAQLRPADPLPREREARLDAARNEFEPFQLVIRWTVSLTVAAIIL